MNTRYLLGLLLINVYAYSETGKDSTDFSANSKTYVSIRPSFQSASPELVSLFRYDFMRAYDEGHQGAFQAVLFGGKTTNDDDFARYFMFCGKTCLDVNGSVDINPNDSTTEDPLDVLSSHFNIQTQNGRFKSRIHFAPEQRQVGLGLHYRQSFYQIEDKNRGYWFSASSALINVRNNMGFNETVLDDGDGAKDLGDDGLGIANMQQTFVQSDWCYGKICCDSMSKTRLADIEVKVGYEWLKMHPYHAESYIGAILPTGNRPKSEFLFEPIVGNGKHFGLMWGSSVGLNLWEHESKERHLRLEWDMNSRYLFSKTHKRSIDLKDRSWSRYLEVYTSKEQAELAANEDSTDFVSPGINVFTRDVKVTPRFSGNVNTGFVYHSCNFQGEVGINFFASREEKVELDCPFPTNIAIVHIERRGRINPVRNIHGNLVETVTAVQADKYDEFTIKCDDLDLSSAATPSIITHTFYATVGYRTDNEDEPKWPWFANLGGSYEFSNSNNAAAERWLVFAKAGIAF